MSEKRPRKYREKVKCSVCQKTVDSDYKTNHKLKMHKDELPVFTPVLPEGQAKLQFFPKRLQNVKNTIQHEMSQYDIVDLIIEPINLFESYIYPIICPKFSILI